MLITAAPYHDWLAHYLVELTLPDYEMLQYQPSIICASAVYLALKTHGQTPWVRTTCALSGAFASL